MRSELSSESHDTGVALQSKMVALSAVLSVLDKCGPSFRSSEKFVFAIRQYLCVSLLKVLCVIDIDTGGERER